MGDTEDEAIMMAVGSMIILTSSDEKQIDTRCARLMEEADSAEC